MRSVAAVGDVLGAVLAGESVGLKLAPVAVGAVVEGAAEGDSVNAEKQSVQPWRVVAPSLVQVTVDPADTATNWGATLLLYRTPATSTKSHPDSVSNSVAVTVPLAPNRTVQASSLPYGPAPSVTQA